MELIIISVSTLEYKPGCLCIFLTFLGENGCHINISVSTRLGLTQATKYFCISPHLFYIIMYMNIVNYFIFIQCFSVKLLNLSLFKSCIFTLAV